MSQVSRTDWQWKLVAVTRIGRTTWDEQLVYTLEASFKTKKPVAKDATDWEEAKLYR